MINEECFTEAWFNSFRKQAAHKKIDTIILEKMIYALHLLEQLQVQGLQFTFKGGTSLVLLLDEGNRFSIDIDIICNVPKIELEGILEKVVANSKFTAVELDTHRSYRVGVPKAHYIFGFNSISKTKYSGKILLDILLEDSLYPETTEKAIQTKWVKTDSEIQVVVPTVDSITGDKLTAFAPNTIGIPYLKGNQSFAMEICKQLFDLGKLFDKIENVETVAKSFVTFAEQEIEYRKNEHFGLTPQKVLQDTMDTCLILAKKGKGMSDEQLKFAQLQKGIIAFGTGFLMSGNFRIDDAVSTSAKVAYLAAKILYNDLTPIIHYNNESVTEMNIVHVDWNFLNKLKKQPDKSGFYYWYKAVELILER